MSSSRKPGTPRRRARTTTISAPGARPTPAPAASAAAAVPCPYASRGSAASSPVSSAASRAARSQTAAPKRASSTRVAGSRAAPAALRGGASRSSRARTRVPPSGVRSAACVRSSPVSMTHTVAPRPASAGSDGSRSNDIASGSPVTGAGPPRGARGQRCGSACGDARDPDVGGRVSAARSTRGDGARCASAGVAVHRLRPTQSQSAATRAVVRSAPRRPSAPPGARRAARGRVSPGGGVGDGAARRRSPAHPARSRPARRAPRSPAARASASARAARGHR